LEADVRPNDVLRGSINSFFIGCLLTAGIVAPAQTRRHVVTKVQAPASAQVNAQGPLRFRHTVVNKTPFPIYASLDYLVCANAEDKVIEPGDMLTIAAGACMLTGVTTWPVDTPVARSMGAVGKDDRWRAEASLVGVKGYSGDGVWVVTWDNALKKFVSTPHLNSLGDMISAAWTLSMEKAGQGVDDAAAWIARLRSMHTCPAPAVTVPKGPANEFELLTLNTYCFPIGTTDALGKVKSIAEFFSKKTGEKIPNLQSGITKPVPQRIGEIARFVAKQGTDVVMFQELWSDANKEMMINNLCGAYPYGFYVPSEVPVYSMVKMDDGLLILSRTPFLRVMKITYADGIDDEKLANKGALLVGLRDRKGEPMLIVNSHLQSGTSLESIQVRQKQMGAVANAIKEMIARTPDLRNCRIVVGGDLNEPLGFIQDPGYLTDRTDYLVRELQAAGVMVSNDQMVRQEARKLGVKEIITVNELARDPDRKGIVRDLDLNERRSLDMKAKEGEIAARNGQFRTQVNPDATDPDATQILDHVFLDNRTKLKAFKVFREEILGGAGKLQGSNLPPAAISDHAAFKVTLDVSAPR
jgi:endonuclease/exonuclease/phosphatase family metal-dependent hydrolase